MELARLAVDGFLLAGVFGGVFFLVVGLGSFWIDAAPR
jgi:hypothetical protein